MIYKLTLINGNYYLVEDFTEDNSDTQYYIGSVESGEELPSIDINDEQYRNLNTISLLKMKYSRNYLIGIHKILSYTDRTYDRWMPEKDRKQTLVFRDETEKQKENRLKFFERERIRKEKQRLEKEAKKKLKLDKKKQ